MFQEKNPNLGGADSLNLVNISPKIGKLDFSSPKKGIIIMIIIIITVIIMIIITIIVTMIIIITTTIMTTITIITIILPSEGKRT